MCYLSIDSKRELPGFITRRWLTDEGARCKDALKWFDQAFPGGGGSLVDVLAACSNKNWISWLLYRR